MFGSCAANAEGGFVNRFLRTRRKAIKPPMRARPTTPPTTPPAIAPGLTFERLETDVEAGDPVLDEIATRVDSIPLLC